MTVTASVRQTLLFPADLPAATQALAHITGRGPQLDQSSSTNKAALDYIYPLSRHRSIKPPISSTRHHNHRAAPRAKSP